MELMKRYVSTLDDADKKKKIQKLAKDAKLSIFEASVLFSRGVDTLEKVELFLDKSLNGLHSPVLMKDAVKAAEAILKNINEKKKIVFYSDYDADGFGSAVVAIDMFKELGIDLIVYTNHRELGYGICKRGIDDILEKHPDVKMLLLADNGIVAFESIEYANSLGLEVVVTDHHQPKDDGTLPNALAVVNPHRLDDDYPFKALCGAAVIWKVLTIVFHLSGIKVSKAKEFLDVVALSTVADVVELVGENRIIVDYGLNKISNNDRIQWKVFKDVFSDFSKITNVDTRTIGFSFGPAINAISRMEGSIDKAIEIFRIEDEVEIYKRVKELKNVNKQRKDLTVEDYKNSMEEVLYQAENPIIIVNDPSFQEGLVGLISGRIKELLNKPCIVLTDDGKGNWKGSGRSIPGYHIKEALDRIQNKYNLMVGYGGHSQACGLTVKKENLEELKLCLLEDAWDIPSEEFVKVITIDYEAKEEEVNRNLLDKIKNLEPYGQGFRDPIIGLKDVEPLDIKYIGSDGQHVVFKFLNFDVVSWYGTEKLNGKIPTKITVSGRLEADDFGLKLFVEPDDIIL